MSDKLKRSFWILLVGLLVLLAFVPRIEDIQVKTRFISGNLPSVAIPNKILSDYDGLFYQKGGGNSIFLPGAPRY